jgi:hypothetical protein
MATGTIVLTRGDDYSEAMAFARDDGSGAYDLRGAALFFTVKERATDPDVDALIAHESGDGSLTITDAAEGEATHEIGHAETDGLATGVYRYDYQVVAADGTVATLERGKLVVRDDVTRATS